MTKGKYLRRIDYIRIISCVMVLLYHLNILKGGYLAVCTFFVLSGYLSTKSFLKENDFSFKKYYINRFRRLYLPLIVVTFIVIILTKFIPNLFWLNLKNESLSVIGGYNNFWQLNANLDYFTRHINSPFMHFWYIAILIQIDVVFPIVAVLLRKLDQKISKHFSTIIVSLLLVTSTIAIVYFSFTKDIMFVYYNTFLRSFSVLFGILTAILLHKYQLKKSKMFEKSRGILFLVYAVALVLFGVFIDANTKFYAIYMLITTIISARLIRYANCDSFKNKAVDGAVQFFSQITYEIYLIQYPIIYILQVLSVDKSLIAPSTIILSVIFACILHILTSTKIKAKGLIIFNSIIILAIIGIGSYYLVDAKDYTLEMQELEDKLNDNLKLMEQQNDNYIQSLNEEKQKWEETLKNIESGEQAIEEYVRNLPVVGVGDSVLLAASPGLKKVFPNGYFDGKVSRTIVGGKELLLELENEGKVGNVVICALANNGDYITKRNKDFMEAMKDKEVFWVDAVKADIPEFNEKFREFAKDYPNLHLIGWEEASKEHPEYFYADGIHVKGDGITAYADTVFNGVYNYYLEEDRKKADEMIKKHEEEQKTRVCFYGNELLINLYAYIKDDYKEATFDVKADYSIDMLYENIKKKAETNTLEDKSVFIFDDNTDISYENYLEIINLSQDKSVLIINMTKEDLVFENDNVSTISLNTALKNNPEFLMPDKKHLSEEGNNYLRELLRNAL